MAARLILLLALGLLEAGSAFAWSAPTAMALEHPTRCGCTASMLPVEDQIAFSFNGARAVFSGEVTGGDSYALILAVDRVWKGDIGETVVLRTGAEPSPDGKFVVTNSCQYGFRRGIKYLVYASGPVPGTLATSNCSRTTPIEFAAVDVAHLDALVAKEQALVVP